MATRYFNADGTARPCSTRGPVGGVQHFSLAQWSGSDEWQTPASEMNSTLKKSIESPKSTSTKLAGIRTSPVMGIRSQRLASPRKVADILGNDIFANGERSAPAKTVSRRKIDELAGSILKEVKAAEASKEQRPRTPTARTRKMDNLMSVAFSSGKVEPPMPHVSKQKLYNLAGNLPFPGEPLQLRTMRKMNPRMGEPLGMHEPVQWEPNCKVMEGPRSGPRPSSSRPPVGGKCQVVFG